MTRLTRKLLLSILTVVLSIGALGTTTFAWFTVTNTANVDPFSAQIVSDTGIELSLDGVNWFTTLTKEMVETHIADNTSFSRFNHVTTTDALTFKTLGTNSLEPASSGWLTLRIYFRTETVDELKWTQAAITATEVGWSSDAAFTYYNTLGVAVPVTNGQEIIVNPANAMRVAIVSPFDSFVFAYENATGDIANSYNTALSTGGDLSNGGIGDPGSMSYYLAKTSTLPYGLGSWGGEPEVWTATPVSVIETLTTLATPPTVMTFRTTTNGILPISGTDIDFNAGKGGYVDVKVWFEGYDREAYNALLNLPVNISLKFEGYTTP